MWSRAFNATFDQQQLTVIAVVAVVVAVAAAVIAVIESDVDVVFVAVVVAVAVDVDVAGVVIVFVANRMKAACRFGSIVGIVPAVKTIGFFHSVKMKC